MGATQALHQCVASIFQDNQTFRNSCLLLASKGQMKQRSHVPEAAVAMSI
jgi:hypothetical protein